jgi:uncharacterized protein with NRDE domain
MCSLVILFRPGHDWPVIVGANRDEMADRPWVPPARHWPDRPQVVAGLDKLAGGSWLGINDQGVLAAVMNRMNSLGPAPGRRSRGELVLEALDHADASEAVQALQDLDSGAYRPFNMVIADSHSAFWLRNLGHKQGWVEAEALPEGLSMVTARDRNDTIGSLRMRRYLPLFQKAAAPDPAKDNWAAWAALLSSREYDSEGNATDAMAIMTDSGFQTTSSSLIALPQPAPKARAVWRFAAGLPGEKPFEPIVI